MLRVVLSEDNLATKYIIDRDIDPKWPATKQRIGKDSQRSQNGNLLPHQSVVEGAIETWLKYKDFPQKGWGALKN